MRRRGKYGRMLELKTAERKEDIKNKVWRRQIKHDKLDYFLPVCPEEWALSSLSIIEVEGDMETNFHVGHGKRFKKQNQLKTEALPPTPPRHVASSR